MAERTILIIGASGGIGLATTHALIRRGVRVIATYHQHGDTFVGLVADVGRDRLRIQELDVTDAEAVIAVLDDTRTAFGSVDSVIYAPSAPIPPRPLFGMEWGAIAAHIDVQAKGLFSVFQGLRVQVQKRYPTRFVIVASEVCIGAPPIAYAPYVVGKYALLGLTKAMAVEIARFGSMVTMVSPGLVETALTTHLSAAVKQEEMRATPTGCLTTPEDVAEVLAWLACDAPAAVNGAHLTVNGGIVML